MLLGGDADVTGEVYVITPALERKLDEIEELYPQQTDEYFKRTVVVQIDERAISCIVYEDQSGLCRRQAAHPRWGLGQRPLIPTPGEKVFLM